MLTFLQEPQCAAWGHANDAVIAWGAIAAAVGFFSVATAPALTPIGLVGVAIRATLQFIRGGVCGVSAAIGSELVNFIDQRPAFRIAALLGLVCILLGVRHHDYTTLGVGIFLELFSLYVELHTRRKLRTVSRDDTRGPSKRPN